jgi:hypothetical protein
MVMTALGNRGIDLLGWGGVGVVGVDVTSVVVRMCYWPWF